MNNLFFIIFFISIILAGYQTFRIDAPNYELKLERHNAIVSNSIDYPYKYRVLNPYITHASFRLCEIFLPEKPAFLFAYTLQNIIVYFFLIFAFSKFVSLWFDNTGIIPALLILGVLIPLTLTGYDNLGDITTAGIMSLGFYFINTNRNAVLYPLMFIGAFNELQVILLAVFYFISSPRRNYKNTVLLILTFLAAYYLIYLIRGGRPVTENLAWLYTKEGKGITDFQFNLTHPDFIPLWLITIIPLLFFALKNFKTKPFFLSQSIMIVLPLFYVFAFLFIARMRELDKALAVFVILIPAALFTLLPDSVKKPKPA